jgi:hypothetical protein
VAIPADRNVTQKVAQEKTNTRVFVETQRTWNMKFMFIPVITGATTTVTHFKEKLGKSYQENFQ